MEVKREIINGRIVKKAIWKGKLTNVVRKWKDYLTDYADGKASLPLVYPHVENQFSLFGDSDGSDLNETLIEVEWTNGDHDATCLHVTSENIDLDHHEIMFAEKEMHGELNQSFIVLEGCPRTIMENNNGSAN